MLRWYSSNGDGVLDGDECEALVQAAKEAAVARQEKIKQRVSMQSQSACNYISVGFLYAIWHSF